MTMTFNEGMQIDTSTTSTGGGGGRGIAIGGGLGGLLVVLVAVFLGIDPSQVSTPQQALPPGAEQSGPRRAAGLADRRRHPPRPGAGRTGRRR